MGQLVNAIYNHPKGTLPSNTKINPKGDESTEQCKVVALRSGKELKKVVKEPTKKAKDLELTIEESKEIEKAWSLGKHAIYQWSWSIKRIGQSRSSILNKRLLVKNAYCN